MDVKQCFKVLEIKETDSLDEIKQAYRDLIAIWHPDRYAQNHRLQEKATGKEEEAQRAGKAKKGERISMDHAVHSDRNRMFLPVYCPF
jgi:curved DNA-binding protein CbpA